MAAGAGISRRQPGGGGGGGGHSGGGGGGGVVNGVGWGGGRLSSIEKKGKNWIPTGGLRPPPPKDPPLGRSVSKVGRH